MRRMVSRLSRSLAMAMAASLVTACVDEAPVAPGPLPSSGAELTTLPTIDTDGAIATIRRATARYHDLNVALVDGFTLLHECEVRPGEGPVGEVYVNFGRVLDGAIDPDLPDALVYEPAGRSGRVKLVAVEFAMPYALWTDPSPPTFMGAEFQREDEFGVFGLHVWVWRNNPDGLFEEVNPRISCGTIG